VRVGGAKSARQQKHRDEKTTIHKHLASVFSLYALYNGGQSLAGRTIENTGVRLYGVAGNCGDLTDLAGIVRELVE
jgi:hypothetical protein